MGIFTEQPSNGRLVHYVMKDADYAPEGAYASGKPPVIGGPVMARGHHRPAIIVDSWGNENEADPKKWTVNLLVFVDGMNDGYPGNIIWRPSIEHSEDKTAGTWHWPERV